MHNLLISVGSYLFKMPKKSTNSKNQKKCLIVFFSLTGNAEFIAETVAAKFRPGIKTELMDLNPEKRCKKIGFSSILRGGAEVVFKCKPRINLSDADPGKYDLIIIGTPVWAGTFTPALRSFFSKVKLQGKKIALFICHAGGPGKTIANMESQLKGNLVIARADFKDPKKDENNYRKAAEKWAGEIMKSL